MQTPGFALLRATQGGSLKLHQHKGLNDGTTGPTTAQKAERRVGEPRGFGAEPHSAPFFIFMCSFLLGSCI